MQRVPNPGSDIDTLISTFQAIYETLKNKEFDLDDISKAMIDTHSATSQGAIGQEALKRSTRTDRSRDPLYNQSKMYSEVWRILGWIHSTDKALKFVISLLGSHIATAQDVKPLVHECLLGITYPNEVLKVKNNHNLRIMFAILKAMNELEFITRNEIIVGPMNIPDDKDTNYFHKVIELLKKCRSSKGKIKEAIKVLSGDLGISTTTMENYTRLPVASLKWSIWGNKQGHKIYITREGKELVTKLRTASDIRLSDFNDYPDVAKPAFIRWTFYSMLLRSGFDVSPVQEIMEQDKQVLQAHNLPYSEYILFSPFQILSRNTLKKWNPELLADVLLDKNTTNSSVQLKDSSSHQHIETVIFELSETTIKNICKTNLLSNFKDKLKHHTLSDAIDFMINEYENSNKSIFYPLVSELFSVMGFNCRVSRAGQNYERADAIILDKEKSIPIEIKSPGEETEISMKGVRQALENKIVFLSRKQYPTDKETTSLVVGFNKPNVRSEVHEFIEDIHNAFGLNVSVIDFKVLLTLAAYSIQNNKRITIQDFYQLKGVVNEQNIKTKK